MELLKFYYFFIKKLKNKYYSEIECENIFFELSCYIFNCKKHKIRMMFLNKKKISKKKIIFYKKSLIELLNNKPLQYIIKESYFFNLKFVVNKKVFIPRPETEELVSWFISDYKCKSNINIIDICTGSGNIAISIKKNKPNFNVFGIDSSYSALKIAKLNSFINNVKVTFKKINILKMEIPKYLGFFDVFISNPPYIKLNEINKMLPNVYKYEPLKSLFVFNNDPLIFYKKIINQIEFLSQNKFVIYFEINPLLVDDLIILIKKYGFKKIKIKKDFKGSFRFIKIIGG